MIHHALIFIFFISIYCIGQVNIEQYRDNNGLLKNQYHKVLDLSSEIQQGPYNMSSFGATYFKPFVLNKVQGFFLTRINYGESNGKAYKNHSFYHLRIFDTSKINALTPEAYMQYEQRLYSSTQLRYLAGIGGRTTAHGLRLGASIMNEWVKEINQDIIVNYWRLSMYMAHSTSFNQFNRVSGVIYFQPELFNLNNIRYHFEGVYLSDISPRVSYRASAQANLFSNSSVYSQTEWSIDTGFQFKF
ncbi:MAG: hypothetical protein ISQ13_01335 [Candidatus Margulisbacteria bacterium]|nr:hypothetical protein [Candidatus Margulisiibacteriota bacterium]